MIDFQNLNANVNFKGIKISKPNIFSGISKIKESLPSDIFCRQSNIPQSLIEDGISEKTFNKAKRFVVKSVNRLYPKESMVILNNGKIEDMIICNSHSGSLSAKSRELASSPFNNVVLIHSHPKTTANTTCPPSIGDWTTLNAYSGMNSMYVLSKDGEYAILRKINRTRLSDDEINKAVGRFMLGYIDYLKKINMPATRECVNLFEYGLDFVSGGANPYNISNRFGELVDKIDHAGLTVEYVDNFWKKSGDKLNITYESNLNKLS